MMLFKLEIKTKRELSYRTVVKYELIILYWIKEWMCNFMIFLSLTTKAVKMNLNVYLLLLASVFAVTVASSRKFALWRHYGKRRTVCKLCCSLSQVKLDGNEEWTHVISRSNDSAHKNDRGGRAAEIEVASVRRNCRNRRTAAIDVILVAATKRLTMVWRVRSRGRWRRRR